jgi:hypothetical protein
VRRSFKREVRDYVIVERYKRKPWQQIAVEVRERFGIEPPSIRIMQSWFQAYRTSTDDPTGVKFIATAVEEAANRATPIAYAKMMTEMPHLWQLHEQHKVPLEDAGWMTCLSVLEAQIGRDNFDRIVSDYQKLREGFIQKPQAKGK